MPSNPKVRAWRAPGRVNIIGEHIDYLGGTVLPFACDRELVVTASTRPGPVELRPADGGDPVPGSDRYIEGVVAALRQEGIEVIGCQGEISSTIPVGAGLSSSAALEAAVALAVTGGVKPSPAVLQRAEQIATGVPCGVMDQTAVLEGGAGHALLLDCATGSFEHVLLPPSAAFVVVDTGTRRRLADGRYAQRRRESEDGHPARLRHARTEQARVYAAVEAIGADDVASLGALLNESHASLRDDFEVSSDALEAAVAGSVAHPACLGARLVGAGFAGCVLALVRASSEEAFCAHVEARMQPMSAFVVRAVGGAGLA